MPEPRLLDLPRALSDSLVVLPAWLAGEDDARALLAALVASGCPGVRSVTDAAAMAKGYGASPMIVIGNLNDNAVMADLYKKRLAFIDAYFPGAGGYCIRLVQAPSVLPHPLLVVGGSGEEATRQAVRTLAESVRQGWALPPVVSPLLPAPPVRDQIAGIVQAAVTDKMVMGDGYGPSGSVAEWVFLYVVSGEPAWGQLARAGLLELIAAHGRQESFGPYLKGQWEFFYLWYLVTGWRRIETDPIFSTADREAVLSFLEGWGDLTSEACYLQPGANLPGEIRQNHALCAAVSMLDVADYFHRSGRADADKVRPVDSPAWRSAVEQSRVVVEGQLSSYRPNDDGGANIYTWNNVAEMIHWYMQQGDLRMFQSGQVARLADVAILTYDNRRDEVSYGDCMHYTPWAALTHLRPFYVLSPAAWFHRDGAYQWVYRWLSEGKDPARAFSFAAGGERWDIAAGRYVSDVPPVYPAGYCGTSVLLLDEGALRTVDRWYGDPGRAGQVPFGTEPVLGDDTPLPIDYARWRPAPGARYVDKISFRPSFDAADEYLCLKGTGTFCHGHRDANAIARLTWKDRCWLIDLDYNRGWPQHHNLVHVLRDGQGIAYPPLATLEQWCDFPGLGITRTALRRYNGTEWQRAIIWVQGRGFAVLDDVEIHEAGDYEVECLWRTLGEVSLTEGRLDVEQAGADKSRPIVFSILPADPGSAASWLTSVRTTTKSIVDRYPHASPEVRVLHQGQGGHLKPGERVSFANLLCAPQEGQPPLVEWAAAAHGLFRMHAGSEEAFLGILRGPLDLGDIQVEADVVYWTPARLCLAGCTRLSIGAHSLSSPIPFDLDLNLNTHSGAVVLPESAGQMPADKVRPHVEGFGLAASPVGQASPVKLGAAHFSLACDVVDARSLVAAYEQFRSTAPADTATRRAVAPAPPVPEASLVWTHSGPATATATACAGLGSLRAFGDAAGEIRVFDSVGREAWRANLGERVRALQAIDFGDGQLRLAAGTADGRVHLLTSEGQPCWSRPLTNFRAFGDQQRPTTLAAMPQGTRNLLLVGTEASHVFAYDAAGSDVWDSFIKYHAVTALATGDLLGDGHTHVVVGTEYRTPINVLDSAGRRLWHSWEQVGSEHRSTTIYSGFDVRALRLADLNGDGILEIVYGTGDMLVLAVEPHAGRHVWKTDVGGEAVGLEVLPSPGGSLEVVVATDAGFIWRLDAAGRPLAYRHLDTTLTAFAASSSGPLVASGASGLWLLDRDLTPMACVEAAKAASLLIPVSSRSGSGFAYAAGSEFGEIRPAPGGPRGDGRTDAD